MVDFHEWERNVSCKRLANVRLAQNHSALLHRKTHHDTIHMPSSDIFSSVVPCLSTVGTACPFLVLSRSMPGQDRGHSSGLKPLLQPARAGKLSQKCEQNKTGLRQHGQTVPSALSRFVPVFGLPLDVLLNLMTKLFKDPAIVVRQWSLTAFQGRAHIYT